MKLIQILFIVFFCYSGQIVAQSQLFELRAEGLKEREGRFYFENDTLRITYAFWAPRGVMVFKIENKLNKPLYINWAKSSFTDNTHKMDYWSDDSLAEYGSYEYTGNIDETWFNAAAGNEPKRIVVNERVTFIPPKGAYFSYSRRVFALLPTDYYLVDGKCDRKFEKSSINPNKQVLVLNMSYTKRDSPLRYKNFITYSTDEKFGTEFYLAHDFFLGTFTETETKHFNGPVRGQNADGTPKYAEPNKKNTAFFIEFKEK